MFNVQQITSRLSEMSDGQLAQYARMHKDDPYVLPLAAAESKRRQQIRQGAQAQQAPQATVADQDVAQMEQEALPEERGIGMLPERSLVKMADGGIAGYADGGKTELDQYVPKIVAEARRLGVDPQLALRMFSTESGGKKGAVSPKGAAGLGQLMEKTARGLGLSPEERFDPEKNITASLTYLKSMMNKYKDPVKAVAAYNWGPGNLDKHLAKNQGEINPVGLPKETAKYITKLLPFSSAAAADEIPRTAQPKTDAVKNPFADTTPAAAPAPAATAARAPTSNANALYSDESVPTPDVMRRAEERRAAAEKERGSWFAQRGRELIGMPEAALSLGTTFLSPVTAPAYAGIRGLLGHPTTAEEAESAVTFTPPSSYGKESLSGAQRAIEDFKIPPYIGHIPVPKAPVRAPAAVAKAAEATEAAAEAARRAETPRLTYQKPAPAGATPEAVQMAERAAEVRRNQALVAERQRVKALQDEAAARNAEAGEATAADTVAQQMQGEGLRASNATAGLGALGIAGQATPGQVAPETPAPEGVDYMAGYKYGDNYFPPKEEAPAATPEAQPEAETAKPQTGGLSNEDILTMGLNMMMAPAGQPGGALSQLASNIGRSGLATLQAKREREKTARETEMNAIMQKYYGEMAKKVGQPPEEIALAERWAKENNVPFSEAFRQIQEAKYDPRASAALEQLRLRAGYGMGVNPLYSLMGGGQGGQGGLYDINPGGSGTGFRVLGSREK